MKSKDYGIWLAEVKNKVNAITSGAVDLEDLPDYDFQTAFNDGKKPETVAKAVIREAGGSQVVKEYNKATKKKPEKPLPFAAWKDEVRAFVTAKGRISFDTIAKAAGHKVRELYDAGRKPKETAEALLADHINIQRTGDPMDAAGDEYTE